MENLNNTVPINQEEVKNRLKSYINDNKGLLINIGVGTGLYLLGRQNGVKNGYCKGYGQCFTDMFKTTNNVK